ncbi:MAG: hypothetical protein NVSMB12_14870 [Acidimicrobiales bacterium]
MSDSSSDPDSLEQRLAAMEKRLEGLEEELAQARADARQILPDHSGPRFTDSGTEHPELTDDAIAPPG